MTREKIKEMYNVDSSSLVTDGAANMRSMGKKVSMVYSCCQAHVANLLMKDVGNDLTHDDILDQVTVVQKEFRKPNLHAEIIALGGHAAFIANETRWCSRRNALLNYRDNRKYYLIIASSEKNFKPEIKNLLLDDVLNARVNELLMDLDPVSKLLRTFGQAECYLGEATDAWLGCQVKGHTPIIKAVQNRMEKSKVINEISLMAYLLDNKYRGRLLKDNGLYDTAKDHILAKLTGAGQKSFCDFE